MNCWAKGHKLMAFQHLEIVLLCHTGKKSVFSLQMLCISQMFHLCDWTGSRHRSWCFTFVIFCLSEALLHIFALHILWCFQNNETLRIFCPSIFHMWFYLLCFIISLGFFLIRNIDIRNFLTKTWASKFYCLIEFHFIQNFQIWLQGIVTS